MVTDESPTPLGGVGDAVGGVWPGTDRKKVLTWSHWTMWSCSIDSCLQGDMEGAQLAGCLVTVTVSENTDPMERAGL